MRLLKQFLNSDYEKQEMRRRIDSLEIRLDRLENFIEDEYAPGWQMEQKVLRSLSRLMTPSEIADSINKPEAYTLNLLEQMKKKNLVVEAGRRKEETLYRKIE